MYNIAKVAKGEILIYFNNIFDQLCKVCGENYLGILFFVLTDHPSLVPIPNCL